MLIKFILIILFSAAVLAGGAWLVFGPVENKDRPIVFTVTKDQNTVDVILKLKEQNLIKNKEALGFLYLIFAKNKQILPGGYRLNKNLNAWQVLQKITSRPDLVWVTVPEGSRKEQIGELLAKALDWNESEQKKWNDTYTQVKQEYIEGVYFPDTYLIPRDEGEQAITQRFINNFNEKFAPYLPKFAQKNILWTTGIKIASLIQREAAGAEDMPLISGIIWNRLEKGMKLEIDATLQYIRGKTDEGWWGKVYLSDKQVDSPYNTYIYKGLPPHPIANPGLTAIEAALNPAETNCLYYLHDSNKQIHCAKTYEEHQENIRKFL